MIYHLSDEEINRKITSRQVTIGFIGLGRVGLPLAAVLAEAGFSVTGVDIKPGVVKAVKTGQSPYADEQGLAEILERVALTGKLKASVNIAEASDCEVYIIALPTLIQYEEPDITAIETIADKLSALIQPGKLVVLESTVPPGTTEGVLGKLITTCTSLEPGRDFGLAYSPERTQSLQVLRDLKTYPKIAGGIDVRSASIISGIYSSFAPSVIKMKSIIAAELDKVIENTYRDVNIAFANELAMLCELYGVDITELIETANSQPYCQILQPGLVGGHCIPMDPYYIITSARSHGFDPRLMATARKVNEEVFDRVIDMLEPRAENVAILGLSFKPDVKSFDTSHSLKLAERLVSAGYKVTVHDPFLDGEVFGFRTEGDVYKAVSGADCLILSTAHREYSKIDFERVKELMNGTLVFDIRKGYKGKVVANTSFL